MDFLQISNVYTAGDLDEIKDLVRRKPQTSILVNIEHPDTLPELEKILSRCDGIVLSRNWLANFVPDKFNIGIQKDIIKLCKVRGKIVMVKGQIFRSMFNYHTPSLIEVNDMVSLVEQACDAVILERCTTADEKTLECVEQLSRVIM